MKILINSLVIVFVVSIIGMIFLLGFVPLDNKEVMLISIILTMLSILSSWIVSHLYSESNYKNAVLEVEEDHQAKLKTYALKAAEKVNNLSSELNKLSFYLQQELEQDYDNPLLQNFAREERIKSAIHLIGTLKSVNDTSLSDWKGVIGEELEEQEEDRKEQINELHEIIEKYEFLASDLRAENSDYSEDNSNIEIKTELKNLKKDIGLIINNLSGTTAISPKPYIASKRQDVTSNCLNCQAPITYRQKAKPSSFKKVVCANCQEVFVGKWNNEKGFFLEDELVTNESVKCPWCEKTNIIDISNLPITSIVCNCNNCNKSFRAVRTINAINIKPVGQEPIVVTPPIKTIIAEEVITEVKKKLPEQPWPTGIHKIIAQELKMPNRQVNIIIQELIKRGDFKPQIDGKVYENNMLNIK